jgi:imidazolonepropionase-like amidohydrolase
VLLRNGTIMTAAGPTLAGADVLLVGETIAQVGRRLDAPPETEIVDLAGRYVTPGIIDPHSHLGIYPSPALEPHADGNESTGPTKPEVRVLEGFWPQDPGLRTAVAGGVTTIHVLPGSANLVGGQGATLHVLPARAASELAVEAAPDTMKLACGENPKRVYGSRGSAPGTRMAEVAMLRQALEEARAYKLEEGKPRDFGKEALKRVLAGEILIQNHCYRADEMLVRLALFREFAIKPRAFHHATEAYKIRDVLAREGVGAVVWADWWGNKLEMLDAIPANAALLDAAGVRVALHSDSADDIQRLNQQAALAMAAGLRAGLPVDRDRAIRWITANPAWILGIEDRVGTLEAGKRADLTVWSRDPFSVYARAESVWIDGARVYDIRDPDLWPPTDADLVLRAASLASPARAAKSDDAPQEITGESPPEAVREPASPKPDSSHLGAVR